MQKMGWAHLTKKEKQRIGYLRLYVFSRKTVIKFKLLVWSRINVLCLWNQYTYLEQQFLKKPGIVLAVNRGFTMHVVCKSENLKSALLKTDFWHAGKKHQWIRNRVSWNHFKKKETQFKDTEFPSYRQGTSVSYEIYYALQSSSWKNC